MLNADDNYISTDCMLLLVVGVPVGVSRSSEWNELCVWCTEGKWSVRPSLHRRALQGLL